MEAITDHTAPLHAIPDRSLHVEQMGGAGLVLHLPDGSRLRLLDVDGRGRTWWYRVGAGYRARGLSGRA